MTNHTAQAENSDKPGSSTPDGLDPSTLPIERWVFVIMLVLAIVGVGVTQIEETGGFRYWSALILIYAVISVVQAWIRAQRLGHPVWPMIRSQILHWLGALIAIGIVLLFERLDIANRGPAADYSLLILALSCYLAGVHFNWTFMLLGGILAVIAVGLGYLDQITIYLITIPLAAVAIWYVFKRKFGSAG